MNRKILLRVIYCLLAICIAMGSSLYFVTDRVAIGDTTMQDSSSADFPESYMITAKNYFDYQSGLECSAFSSAYILRHYGEEADGVELFKTFPGKVQSRGAPPQGIVKFFQNRGYEAEYKCDGTVEALKRELSKGVPVIVFIRVDEQTVGTHYVPLVGYDKDYFYFAESLPYMANCRAKQGVSYNRRTEISTFKRLWWSIDGIWNYPYFVIAKKTSL